MNEYAWRLLILCVFWWMAAVPDLRARQSRVDTDRLFTRCSNCRFVPADIDRQEDIVERRRARRIPALLTLVSKRKIGKETDSPSDRRIDRGIGRILVILEGALVLVSLTGFHDRCEARQSGGPHCVSSFPCGFRRICISWRTGRMKDGLNRRSERILKRKGEEKECIVCKMEKG